jgi:hypothetical protein
MFHAQIVLFTTKDTKVQIIDTPNFVLFVSFVVKTSSQQTRKNRI